jgi:N-methylhydantoinase B
MFEVVNPVILERFEYQPDSAGAGRWRGGLGVETIFTFEDGPVQASVFGDGGTDETAAFGILGGRSGCPNSIELRYPDGTVYRPFLKDIISEIPAGTVYHQIAGGGGGYGDPRLRDAGRVAEEARNGVISRERARNHYGVAFVGDGWDVDEQETAELRREARPT